MKIQGVNVAQTKMIHRENTLHPENNCACHRSKDVLRNKNKTFKK